MDQRGVLRPPPPARLLSSSAAQRSSLASWAPSAHRPLPLHFLCQTNIIIGFQLPLVLPPNEGWAGYGGCGQRAHQGRPPPSPQELPLASGICVGFLVLPPASPCPLPPAPPHPTGQTVERLIISRCLCNLVSSPPSTRPGLQKWGQWAAGSLP